MKLLSYSQGAEQIAWRRARRLDAIRDDALNAICWSLAKFKQNKPKNIKCPWKLDRFSLRAWCPLHDGRWVRLIVRAGEDGHVTFHCDAGCSETQVRDHIGGVGDGYSSKSENIRAGAQRQSARGSNILDARHRFQSRKKAGGAWESSSYDDPAA